jgi:hypothetical protein
MFLGERIKRILRHVSFFAFCLTPNGDLPVSSNKNSLVRTHYRPDTPMSKNDATNSFTKEET